MGWEKRGNNQYYYTKERIGRRVVSSYVGASETARLIAEISESRHEIAEWRARDERLEREAMRDLARTPPEVAQALQEARRAVAEALTAAGYHQHKRGEWRKKRGNKDKEQAAG